jgi:Radical SAM superfamily
MSDVLQSKPATGLCSTCYRELFATIEYRSDGAAYITKTCPDHGYEEFMVERSWKFWESSIDTDPDNDTWHNYNGTTAIEVTDRCNVMCKDCYHIPDNSIADLSAEWIITKARSVATTDVTLMGAEPTMRSDLAYIIKEIQDPNSSFRGQAKNVAVYTNGVKLSDMSYVQELADAGLRVLCISVHNENYHKIGIWRNVQKALANVIEIQKFGIGQISFTVENKQEVNDAIDKILWLRTNNIQPFNFCIRSPGEIGTPVNEEIFASEVYAWIDEICRERGLSFSKDPSNGSNPYHVACHIHDMSIQVIHWASVKNVDTTFMNMGPFASFIPHTTGTLHLQIILRDGWKKGWWQGQQIAPAVSHLKFYNKLNSK